MAYNNSLSSGLANPSNYEQGFVNPNANGTQLSGPLGGGPGYTPPTQQQLDYWRANPGQMDEGTGSGPYAPGYTPDAPYAGNQSIGQRFNTMNNLLSQQGANTNINNPQLNAQTNTNASGANDPVSGLYQSLLGRAPDAGGLAYWNQQLASGKSIQDIANAFKATSEYQQRQQVQPNPSTAPNTNPYGITTGNQFASSTNPYIQAAQQTSLANLAGAQTATAANRVNQSTPYSNLNYVQTGTDAQGNPIWTAKQSLAGPLQGAQSNLAQSVANQAAKGFNPNTPSVGINPGETYSDAIMRRLQPQQAHAQEQQAAALANQGIMPGSEAYNNAMRTFQQGQNDQLTSAITGGFGVGLQANQQAFNQQLQQANLPITQLGAFQQATQPGYVNPYSQAATSGPDYTGAYATSQAADIAARNAQLQQKNSFNTGLATLSTAGILGGGIPALASGISGAYNWLNPTQYSSPTDYLQSIGAGSGGGFTTSGVGDALTGGYGFNLP